MQNCNQMHACYLFQQDKQYDLSYDTGDKALQCGRHVDIFKLWLMWRAKVGGLICLQEAVKGIRDGFLLNMETAGSFLIVSKQNP